MGFVVGVPHRVICTFVGGSAATRVAAGVGVVTDGVAVAAAGGGGGVVVAEGVVGLEDDAGTAMACSLGPPRASARVINADVLATAITPKIRRQT